MKTKKVLRHGALALLTSGASLILGFLSFSGMLALWPVLPLAAAAFALSVAYEGEVYLQNIKGAWNKLFKRDFLKHRLANDFLLKNFPDTEAEDCPQFFKDYEAQLNLLHKFGHKRLDKTSQAQKKQIEKTLRDMEKWFALQLFDDQKNAARVQTAYESELRAWLASHHQSECQELLVKRRRILNAVKAFSLLAGLFMAAGTSYLLVEAFSVIPLFSAIPFAAWPLWVVPMALIAGTAYGFLTYNAIADMVNNDTIRKWFYKLRDDFRQGVTVRNVFMAIATTFLVLLAIGLTICTAGTWWTVVKEAQPIFNWMQKIPSFVMGIINPIITGISALVFNLQNTSESMELIDEATRAKPGFFARTIASIKQSFHTLRENENWFQILNPFRFLLKVTLAPLRILLFLGHLVSIGVTSDRVPGVPEIASAILGIISEGFEDFHYFVGHDHDHGDDPKHKHKHDHDEKHDHEHLLEKKKKRLQERLSAEHSHSHELDLPTRILKILFYPLYFLAAGWDFLGSKKNTDKRPVLSFSEAWNKQRGVEKEKSVTLPKDAAQPSDTWRMTQVVYRIDHFKEKHLQSVKVGRDVAEQKSAALTSLQDDLQRLPVTDTPAITARLAAAKADPVYHVQRYGFFEKGQTTTEAFVDDLPMRVGLAG